MNTTSLVISIATIVATILAALINAFGPRLWKMRRSGAKVELRSPRPWYWDLLSPLSTFAIGAAVLWWYVHLYEIRSFSHADEVLTLAFSHNGDRFVSGGKDGLVRLWDVETGQEVRRFRGGQGSMTCVAFSLDDRRVVAGSDDGWLRMWELGQEEPAWEQKPPGLDSQPMAVAFMPGESRLFLVARSDRLTVYDTDGRQHGVTFDAPSSTVQSLTLSLTGHNALTGPDFCLWDVTTGHVVGGPPTLPYVEQEDAISLLNSSLRGLFHEAVLCLAFAPGGGDYFASGNHWEYKPHSGTAVQRNDIVLWNVRTWKEVRRFEGHHGKVTAVAFTPDGRHIVSGSEDGSVRVWDRDSGEQLRHYLGHLDWFANHEVTSVAVDPKQGRAISASRDKTVRLWRLPR